MNESAKTVSQAGFQATVLQGGVGSSSPLAGDSAAPGITPQDVNRDPSSRQLDQFRRFDQHFWVCSSPYFETVLLMESGDGHPFLADIYDADGSHINTVSAQFGAGKLGVLELGHLLEGCKLEGGLKHGHAVINGGEHGAVLCRLQARDCATVHGTSQELSLDKSLFYPVTFCDERTYLVTVINLGTAPTSARCRLFFGKRTPEISVTIPPHGARILSLNAEFSEFAEVSSGKQVQSYVRLSTREQSHLGVQLIERCQLHGERFLYSSIA